jgi:hypothetical protein
MCNRCSFLIPQTAIDTLFQHHKLQYPTITEHHTHHIHYDLPSPKLRYFTKNPIHKLKYNSFQDLTPVGLSKTNLNPTKICTSARVPSESPSESVPAESTFYTSTRPFKLIAILTKPIPTGRLMRIWLGLLLKITDRTKSYKPPKLYYFTKPPVNKRNCKSFQGSTPKYSC